MATVESRSTKLRALRALVAALEAEVSQNADAAAVVRQQVERLEKLPRASLDALDVVQTALTAVLDALASATTPATESASYRRAVAMLGTAVEALRRPNAILTYRADETVAFRAATNALLISARERPPFRDPDPPTLGLTKPPTYAMALVAAQLDVEELRRGDWGRADAFASRALLSLAEVAGSMSCTSSDAVENLRFEARRMRWTRAAGVLHARSILRGLSTVLDILEPQATRSGHSFSAARSAVNAIDPRSSIAFQRDPIVDAFAVVIAVAPSREPAKRTCP